MPRCKLLLRLRPYILIIPFAIAGIGLMVGFGGSSAIGATECYFVIIFWNRGTAMPSVTTPKAPRIISSRLTAEIPAPSTMKVRDLRYAPRVGWEKAHGFGLTRPPDSSGALERN
ncbi:MAG: hypothetical protein V1907_01685 [Candidatus Kerfeldbacteria bacterium]